MSEKTGFFERLDDAFNPIVVRELRQAVQGKFVSAVLLLLLVIQLTAIGIYLMSGGDVSTSFDAGRNAFMILHSILLSVCLLFVPAYTAFRLGSERSDTNVDLLFITTIRPRAIIWGKVVAALTITVLIFSACMPFMVFTYWLRGIDLPSIFVMLAFAFLVVVAANQLAAFIASIPANRVLRVLLGVAGICILPELLLVTLGTSFAMLRTGVGSRLESWSFWGPASAVLVIVLVLIGLLFSLSVALVTPASANRALPVRVYIMIAWFAGGVVSAIIGYVDKGNTAIIVWGILSAVIFFLGFFVAVSERESLGPRVLRKIPRNGVLRFPAFLLFSGASSGVAWCGLMCALTLAAVACWRTLSPAPRGDRDLGDAMVWIAGLGLYGFCYSMSAVFVRTMFLERWLSAKFTWLVGIVLLGLGSIVPFVIGYLLFFDSRASSEQIGIWLLGNPFAFSSDSYQSVYLVFAGCWAGLAAVLNIRWFHQQVEAFRPPEPKAEAAFSQAV